MGKLFVLESVQWTIYRKTMLMYNLCKANEALKKISKLVHDEYEILKECGKIKTFDISKVNTNN